MPASMLTGRCRQWPEHYCENIVGCPPWSLGTGHSCCVQPWSAGVYKYASVAYHYIPTQIHTLVTHSMWYPPTHTPLLLWHGECCVGPVVPPLQLVAQLLWVGVRQYAAPFAWYRGNTGPNSNGCTQWGITGPIQRPPLEESYAGVACPKH